MVKVFLGTLAAVCVFVLTMFAAAVIHPAVGIAVVGTALCVQIAMLEGKQA